MDTISERNASRTWKEGPTGRGFVETKPRRRVCGGVTKILRRRITKGKGQPVQTIASRQPNWRIHPSSKARGIIVHRVLMHQLMCVALKRCACPGSPPAAPTDSFGRACQQAAERFVADYHLEPVAAEMIVLHPTLPIGTRFDALFRDKRSRKLVLVSWKTGVGARNVCEWTRAHTQVAWEWAMIERWAERNEERIHAAFIVYLGAATDRRTNQLLGFYSENRITRKQAAELAGSLDTLARRRR